VKRVKERVLRDKPNSETGRKRRSERLAQQ